MPHPRPAPSRRHHGFLPAALLLLPLLAAAAPAQAASKTGPYVEAQLGYAFPDPVDVSDGPIDGGVDLKDAFVFGGAVGYRFPWVRLELNGSWRKFDVDQVKASGFGSSGGDGDASAAVGLVNLYLDPSVDWPVRPFIGGVGGAYVSVDTGDDSPIEVDDEAGAFAWNLMAGLSYNVTPAVTLSAGYRYLRLEGTDFSASLAGVDTGDVDVDDVVSHEVVVGLRYTF